MTAQQVSEQLAPSRLMTLAGSTFSDGLLTLSFRDAADIIAGRPYIICWDDGDDLVNPTFRDVTITFSHSSAQNINTALTHLSIQTDYATFTGNMKPLWSTDGLILDSHNTANGAFRATLTLADPANSDYSFEGWFTDAGLTTPLTTIPPLDNDGKVKLYAKFSTTVSIAKEGYGTYHNSTADAVLPAGMKARIVTAQADGNSLTYQTIADGNQSAVSTATVPAGTAVMLQTAPAETSRNIDIGLVTPTDGRDFSANNLLHGSDKEATTTGGSQYYKLSYNSEGEPKLIGWYWGAENGGAFTSAAHKAWLALPSGSEAPLRSIALPGFDDNTTDIPLIPYQTEHERGTMTNGTTFTAAN